MTQEEANNNLKPSKLYKYLKYQHAFSHNKKKKVSFLYSFFNLILMMFKKKNIKAQDFSSKMNLDKSEEEDSIHHPCIFKVSDLFHVLSLFSIISLIFFCLWLTKLIILDPLLSFSPSSSLFFSF